MPSNLRQPYRRQRMERAFNTDEIAMFGTTSDLDVAERIGCSAAKVWNARTKLKIPAYRKWRPIQFPPP